MSVLQRLERAVDFAQPVMFDAHEAALLYSTINGLYAEIKELQRNEAELISCSLHQAQETSGLLLKATLAGYLISQSNPESKIDKATALEIIGATNE